MDPAGMPFSPDTVANSQVQVIPYGVEIPNRVFVGGCPYNMTDMELAEFFSQFGHIKDSKIITDRDTGKSKGYGFVTFITEEEAASVHCRGSIYYKEKKLNVSKAIRKQGGQYPKANTEYMNGQRSVWLHPGGYLISQYDGSWHYELTHPHTQPSKVQYPCYSMYPQTGIYLGQPAQVTSPHTPYLQSPMLGGAPPLSHTNGYTPGGFYSPTYTYVPEPMPSTIPTLNPVPPSHHHTFTPSSTTTATPHDEPRTSLEDSGSHSISSADPAHLSDQGATVTSEGEEPTEHEDSGEIATSDKTGLEHQVKQLSLDSAYTSEADITEQSLNKSLTEQAREAILENAPGSSSSDSESSHTPPLSQELLKSIFSNRRAGSAPTSPYQQQKRYQQRRSSRPSQHCVSAGGPRVLQPQPFL